MEDPEAAPYTLVGPLRIPASPGRQRVEAAGHRGEDPDAHWAVANVAAKRIRSGSVASIHVLERDRDTQKRPTEEPDPPNADPATCIILRHPGRYASRGRHPSPIARTLDPEIYRAQ